MEFEVIQILPQQKRRTMGWDSLYIYLLHDPWFKTCHDQKQKKSDMFPDDVTESDEGDSKASGQS